jgi:uncharacterized membrane protein YhaH (DUF805 family)
MPDLLNLLLSFKGRIGRRSWWLGYIIVVVASLFGTALLNPDFFTPDEVPVVPPPSWPDTVWQVVCLVPGTAITVKRFNDRDWPWWLGYAAGVLAAALYIAPHFGLPIDPLVSGVGRPLFWIIGVALLAIFIDNGFFRGTDGPNRYGPDPLDRNVQTS